MSAGVFPNAGAPGSVQPGPSAPPPSLAGGAGLEVPVAPAPPSAASPQGLAAPSMLERAGEGERRKGVKGGEEDEQGASAAALLASAAAEVRVPGGISELFRCSLSSRQPLVVWLEA